MNPADSQLVQQITQQVLAVLRDRAVGSSGASSGTTVAPVRPPAGTCTGDYSQFPELIGKLNAVSPAPPVAAPLPTVSPSGIAASGPSALTGIITASRLKQAMDQSPDQVATLAPDARLTPLADDLARQFPQRIRRASATASSSIVSLPWAWWIEGTCPLVKQVISVRAARFQNLATAQPSSDALSQVVRELATALANQRIAGGILFVRSSALAACLANRLASIRAVVGTGTQAVEQGIIELAANVLIIEYPQHGLYAMGRMVDRIMQQDPQPSAQVQRDLTSLTPNP